LHLFEIRRRPKFINFWYRNFGENFDFWQKVRFFGEKFDFWQKVRFLAKSSIFGENLDSWPNISFFGAKFLIKPIKWSIF